MRCPGLPRALQRIRQLVLVVAVLLALAAAPALAAARGGISLRPSGASASSARRASAAVARYWTPARMRRARPLGGGGAIAGASFVSVPDTTQPPYRAAGRVFIKIGRYDGFCSGTAINSESRHLVLTAGHCLYNLLPGHRVPTLARSFDFVPGYANGQAPFGEFVGRKAYLPTPWLRRGNENFDMGAVVTEPNSAGLNVADATGGGLPIVTDRPRDQEYQVLGYPGGPARNMQECDAAYAGDDSNTFPLGGPPSLAVGCFMGEGASGGPWLVEGGTAIGGMTTYGYRKDFHRTFGPYFSHRNVGALVAGL